MVDVDELMRGYRVQGRGISQSSSGESDEDMVAEIGGADSVNSKMGEERMIRSSDDDAADREGLDLNIHPDVVQLGASNSPRLYQSPPYQPLQEHTGGIFSFLNPLNWFRSAPPDPRPSPPPLPSSGDQNAPWSQGRLDQKPLTQRYSRTVPGNTLVYFGSGSIK